MVLHRKKHLLPLLVPLSPMDPFPRLESRSSNDSRRTVPSKGFVRVRMAVVEDGEEKGKGWSRARITCAMQKSVEKWKKAPLAAATPSSSRCLIQINTRVCMCVCASKKDKADRKRDDFQRLFSNESMEKGGERPGRNGSTIIDDYYFVIRCWRKGLGSKFTYGCSHLPRSLL